MSESCMTRTSGPGPINHSLRKSNNMAASSFHESGNQNPLNAIQAAKELTSGFHDSSESIRETRTERII